MNDFGLRGELHSLVSERDQNFRLTLPDGKRFVVKVVSAVEAAEVTDFQIKALLHLEEQGVPGVPRIVQNLAGGALGTVCSPNGTEFRLRVATWLRGEPLESFEVRTQTAKRVGFSLGRLDRALSNFAHPADRPTLLWDMHRAGELVDLTEHIGDARLRQRVQTVLATFRDHTSAELKTLPRQVIHNDANPSNILLSEDSATATIIDFGDMMRAARIIEVATAASYLRFIDDPMRFIAPLVSAYHAENPLLSEEFAVLFDLVRTRLAMTITILYWRLSARDEGDSYRQQSLAAERNAFEFLTALDALGPGGFSEAVARAVADD